MERNDKSGTEILTDMPGDDHRSGIDSFTLSILVHKIQRNLEDYGWRVTLRKILAYLVRWIYFRQAYRIYRIKLDEIKTPNYSGRQEFVFKLLTTRDLDLIAQVENTAEWLRGQLEGKIAGGQLCLVALQGDKVAGFNLISLEQASLILVNRKRKLRRGSAWSEHLTVQKEFRRAGLGTQLRYQIFEELKRRGTHRLYGGTLRSNTASLRLTRSIGFKEICDIHYRNVLSFEKWTLKRVRD